MHNSVACLQMFVVQGFARHGARGFGFVFPHTCISNPCIGGKNPPMDRSIRVTEFACSVSDCTQN